MSNHITKVWNPVVSIPEWKINDYEIEHVIVPANSPLSTASMRTELLGGHERETVVYQHETTWHRLSYDGGVWMTDFPIEQAQHDSHLEHFCGNVIIGGLGLGYAVNTLLTRSEIDRVVVVEKSREVIELVAPHIWGGEVHGSDRYEVVHADLFDYLADDKEEHDFAFYDIWQSDSESTFHEFVPRLRELSDNVDNVVCWNEDIMRGQLFHNLQSRMMMISNKDLFSKLDSAQLTIDQLCEKKSGAGSIWINWSVPFFTAIRDGRFSISSQQHAKIYALLYGTRNWETKWIRMMDTK